MGILAVVTLSPLNEGTAVPVPAILPNGLGSATKVYAAAVCALTVLLRHNKERRVKNTLFIKLV